MSLLERYSFPLICLTLGTSLYPFHYWIRIMYIYKYNIYSSIYRVRYHGYIDIAWLYLSGGSNHPILRCFKAWLTHTLWAGISRDLPPGPAQRTTGTASTAGNGPDKDPGERRMYPGEPNFCQVDKGSMSISERTTWWLQNHSGCFMWVARYVMTKKNRDYQTLSDKQNIDINSQDTLIQWNLSISYRLFALNLYQVWHISP